MFGNRSNQKRRSAGGGNTVLTVDKVGKSFDCNGEQVDVLVDLSFQTRHGEFICVLGPSGCGKTTLLNLLAGFAVPSAGEIRLDDAPVGAPGPDRCVVFQDGGLFPWLTVRENVEAGLRCMQYARQEIADEVERFLHLVGLEEFADYLPGQISGGMRQRVALARVLILHPGVLLMDEPFAALDYQTRGEMQDLLLDLWRRLEQTVVFVTHDIEEAIKLADTVLILGAGPATIEETLDVSMPRPRDETSPPFMQLRRQVRDKIETIQTRRPALSDTHVKAL